MKFVQFATDEVEDFANRVIDVEFCYVRRGGSGQGSDALDDVAGTMGIPDDALRAPSSRIELRFVSCKPAQAGAPVGDNGEERLVDLVGDGCREFADRCQSR